MITNWNDNIFNCLRQVNRNLNGIYPQPEKVSALLYGMESCLCSGDGLSKETAFKASNAVVIDRTVSLLGMGKSMRCIDQEGSISVVSFADNPYGIGKLYFRISQEGVRIGCSASK